MFNHFKKYRLTIVLCILLSQAACSGQALEGSLKSYCELYNPVTWSVLGEDASTQEIYGYILSKMDSSVESDKLKVAIKNADNTDFTAYFYSVNAAIENLTGESWECQYFENFYLPKQRVVSLILGGVSEKRINPNADDVITVILANNGELLINNSVIKTTTPDAFIRALQSRIDQRDISSLEFVIYFDAGADANRVARIFGTLATAGIKNVELINF